MIILAVAISCVVATLIFLIGYKFGKRAEIKIIELKSGDIKKETVLNGRIYPAIKACVNNRYKIILGGFAFYAFILTYKIDAIIDENLTEILLKDIPMIKAIGSSILIFFVLHNYLNYFLNNKDEIAMEGRDNNCTFFQKKAIMEALFVIPPILGIIYMGFIYS